MLLFHSVFNPIGHLCVLTIPKKYKQKIKYYMLLKKTIELEFKDTLAFTSSLSLLGCLLFFNLHSKLVECQLQLTSIKLSTTDLITQVESLESRLNSLETGYTIGFASQFNPELTIYFYIIYFFAVAGALTPIILGKYLNSCDLIKALLSKIDLLKTNIDLLKDVIRNLKGIVEPVFLHVEGLYRLIDHFAEMIPPEHAAEANEILDRLTALIEQMQALFPPVA